MHGQFKNDFQLKVYRISIFFLNIVNNKIKSIILKKKISFNSFVRRTACKLGLRRLCSQKEMRLYECVFERLQKCYRKNEDAGLAEKNSINEGRYKK